MNRVVRTFLVLIGGLTLFQCVKDIENPDAEQLKQDKLIMDKYVTDSSWQVEKITEDIYKYKVGAATGSQYPKSNEGVVLTYSRQLTNGTIIDTATSFYQQNQGFYTNGWDFAVSTMMEGERAKFLIPSFYGYGGRSIQVGSKTIPANSVLRLDAKLNKIVPVESIPEYYGTTVKKLQGTRTSTNLFYSITSPGPASEPLIVNGKTVTVKYKGYLFNNYIFDESSSYPVVAGSNSVITGWREVLSYLRKGDKATVVIPSTLAYGAQGAYDSKGLLIIPPDAVIVFEMEILNVQ